MFNLRYFLLCPEPSFNSTEHPISTEVASSTIPINSVTLFAVDIFSS